MTRPGYAQLQDVILDPDFPELDLALRRGRHVDRDDVAWYALLGDAQEHLEAFYRRYGGELVHKPDGYFYLLPTGDKLPRRQLASGDMLVGQALALLYLHPSTIERAGLHSMEELIAQLAAVMGSDALIRAFNPKRRRHDERVAQKTVRLRVAESVRRLAGLGFVELAEGDQLRLRPALMRFAEPVRGLSEPTEALAQLVARGEIALEAATDEADADADVARAARKADDIGPRDETDTDDGDHDPDDPDEHDETDGGRGWDDRDLVGVGRGAEAAHDADDDRGVDDRDAGDVGEDGSRDRGDRDVVGIGRGEAVIEGGNGEDADDRDDGADVRDADPSGSDDERDVVGRPMRPVRRKRDGDPP